MPFVTSYIRGRQIREAIPHIGVCLTDITLVSQIDFEPIPGLSAILEPNTCYKFDGYTAYDADTATDAMMAIDVPELAVGHWGNLNLPLAAPSGGVADIAAGTVDLQQAGPDRIYRMGGTGAAGSPGPMWSSTYGFVQTGAYGGALQISVAQYTSTTSPTTVRAGSWLRCQKVDDVT